MRRLTRDQAVEMRRLYENSALSLNAIASQVGVSPATIQIYSRSQGWHPRRGGKAPDGPRPLRWMGKPCTGLGECPERAALIARAWAAAHVQINEIEMRMTQIGAYEEKAARASDDARAVATLVRTLKDLTGLDKAEAEGRKPKNNGASDDQHGQGEGSPSFASDLADELARRLAGLRKRGSTA
jgi:hypothetical protein